MRDSPSQRPEHFTLNPYSPLSEGLVFAGLGGGGCAGSVRYEDSSWYANHGTLTNMDPSTDWVWVPGLGRWVVDFDGSNDTIIFNPSQCSNTTWTALCWCVDLAGGMYGLIGSGEYNKAWCGVRNGSYAWSGDDKGYYSHTGGTSVWTGTYHFATTYSAPTFRSYKNGIYDGTANGTASTATWQSTSYVAKGNWGFAAGKLADVMIYSRVLSPSEIASLADPSNHMLSGLILPPKRKYYRATTTSGPNLAAAVYYYQRMIAG